MAKKGPTIKNERGAQAASRTRLRTSRRYAEIPVARETLGEELVEGDPLRAFIEGVPAPKPRPFEILLPVPKPPSWEEQAEELGLNASERREIAQFLARVESRRSTPRTSSRERTNRSPRA